MDIVQRMPRVFCSIYMSKIGAYVGLPFSAVWSGKLPKQYPTKLSKVRMMRGRLQGRYTVEWLTCDGWQVMFPAMPKGQAISFCRAHFDASMYAFEGMEPYPIGVRVWPQAADGTPVRVGFPIYLIELVTDANP